MGFFKWLSNIFRGSGNQGDVSTEESERAKETKEINLLICLNEVCGKLVAMNSLISVAKPKQGLKPAADLAVRLTLAEVATEIQEWLILISKALDSFAATEKGRFSQNIANFKPLIKQEIALFVKVKEDQASSPEKMVAFVHADELRSIQRSFEELQKLVKRYFSQDHATFSPYR